MPKKFELTEEQKQSLAEMKKTVDELEKAIADGTAIAAVRNPIARRDSSLI